MMKVLIIGKSGQLARVLQEELTIQNVTFVAWGRTELDLEDLSNVSEKLKFEAPDIIINCAAYTAVDAAEDNVTSAHIINADAPAQLARLSQELDINFIHISTDYVFNGNASTPYSENDQTDPINVYGKSKLAGENEALKLNQNTIVIRTSWVFSEYGNNFVKTMLRLAESRNELGIVSDQFGRPTYARDLARALCSIVQLLATPNTQKLGGIYHFSNQGEITHWAAFAEAIFSKANALKLTQNDVTINHITTSEYPTKAARPRYSALNNARILSLLHENIPDWHTALKESLENIKQAKLR